MYNAARGEKETGDGSNTRILILLTPHLPHNEERLVNNLARMLQGRFELHVCGVDRRVPSFEGKVVQHVSTLRDMLSLKSLVRGIGYYLSVAREVRPCLLASLNVPTIRGPQARIVSLLTGIPYINRLPGDKFHVHESFHGLRKLKEYLQHNVMGVWSFRRAAACITIGQYLTEELARQGVAGEKIWRIAQPVNLEHLGETESRSALRERLGLPEQARVALFVGGLTHEKGADRLAEIARKAAAGRDDLYFMAIGQGPLADAFTSSHPHTRHIPTVPFQEIGSYFHASDILLLPSRSEGVPNVVLEAVGCGLPVLASPVGELPYLLPITYTETDEYVRFLLGDDWSAAMLPQLPEEYGWEFQKERYMTLFEQFINGK